ncbi:DUF1453 domain-containing protein [Pseudolysobacter antarcticus]|uniref:DUF1453 domain-containing protein n=1 Tax=Pseudolysobacter antarcticus TaxID=2511995 RepID=A0A411HFP1_9GAMM|nr:DUF1453 domain-containing protein [Pseudolysobacter antarcticus]QBB69287.1 DUF1453 domain-containing protein [Pseudolysobacter antarcticus]
MTPQALLPLAFIPLALFAVYRRYKRHVGRQPMQPVRLGLRASLMLVLGIALSISAWPHFDVLESGAAGLAFGIALAIAGIRLTQFESTADGIFYTPNVYIGLGITVLLLGRLLYRFVVLFPGMQAAAQANDADAFSAIHKSPLTFGIFALIIGYYVVYNIALLVLSRRHAVANSALV